ncbi:MAG: hypothetical protein P9M11_05850 [Candidatus Tenebribacter burtonii]|jgi:hypothetical protein|nr:hypothetical protein [Candidatus Tenebribacter burtonii]
MLRKLIITIILITIFVGLNTEISKTQNNMNLIFLRELDSNLLETIKIMDVYNQVANNISYDVLGIEHYQKFLMEMTMICMNLRNDISSSVELNSEQREIFVNELINSLKPDVKSITGQITEEQDMQGKQFNKLIIQKINNHLKEIRKEIIIQEEMIIESKTFDQYFFHLHSQQFIYQLVLNFLKPSDYLSRLNRAFIIRVASEIEYNILNSPEPAK